MSAGRWLETVRGAFPGGGGKQQASGCHRARAFVARKVVSALSPFQTTLLPAIVRLYTYFSPLLILFEECE